MTRRTTLSALALTALFAGTALAQNPAPVKPATPTHAAATTMAKDTTRKQLKPTSTSTKKKGHKKPVSKPDSTKKPQ